MSDQQATVYNGRYELHRQIARGGMADVFLARDRLLDRPVAVKVLFPQFATDPAFVERFRREAQSAANLNHPNITSVYDWGQEQDTYFIVMEYVDGRSLAEILRSEGMLHPDRAADIATDVAAALSFAHRNGVVHRDIKPGNILIAPSGQVKVTDFGIARAFGEGARDAGLTQAGSVMGTATYFSPEQAQGLSVDPRSDLYSLGVVLYEVLASRPPFSGESPVAIAYKHVQEQPSSPSSINPRIPGAMDAITMRLLAKDPADRYPSAEDLRADLRRFREGQPVLAGGASRVEQATAAAPAATAAIPVTPTPAGGYARGRYEEHDDYEEPPSRTGWFVAGLVVLVAVLAGLLVIFSNALGLGGGEEAGLERVPGVVGLSETEATEILERAGFEVRPIYEENLEVEPATVFRQRPLADEVLAAGSLVEIWVAVGGGELAMPNVIGSTEEAAVSMLTGLGLEVGDIRYEPHDEAPPGEVLDQFPRPGEMVSAGRSFDLVVSAGPDSVEVPDVRGETPERASQLLTDAGFQVRLEEEPSELVDEGRVVRTDPPFGTEAPMGTFVTVYVSSGPPPPQAAIVPNVVNQTQITAEQQLTNRGFEPEVSFAVSLVVPAGSVIIQDPPGGTELAVGSTVSIVVSTGPPTATTTTEATTTTTAPGP